MSDRSPTERFSTRVENYVRYRPNYPVGVLSVLQRETGLSAEWEIADIGSGPGNLTRLFLDAGFQVVGVEPNDAMREAGEVLMADYARFRSVNGTAESTTLTTGSVDLITAGQAFHWFDPRATRDEFRRISRQPGWVALIWNRRTADESAFLDDYHEMLHRYSTEFANVSVQDERTEVGLSILFGEKGYDVFTIPYGQQLDAESFWGRLISSSYTPLPGEPGHTEIAARSREIFDQYSENGLLEFPYETQIYLGQIEPR